MVDDPLRIISEKVAYNSLKSKPVQPTMSSREFASHCVTEIERYFRGERPTDEYELELLRRATIQNDQEARDWMQQCFSSMVLGWLHYHPYRTTVIRLKSEANYVDQAFERFWQATTLTPCVEFTTLAEALQYLHACLNGVILDTLRVYARPREMPLPAPGEAGEPHVEKATDSREMWEILQTMLPDEREKRLAYLSFHCGLKPREIMRFCPQKFCDIQEIYRLRRRIMERMLRNADQLR